MLYLPVEVVFSLEAHLANETLFILLH
jgi:hypothetical protein